jgi:hypothetical protein
MPSRRAGVAAIAAGALIFAGHGGELIFDSPEVVFAVLGVSGFVALVVAVWGLRGLMVTRMGRVGSRIARIGVVLLGLFGVQVLVELIRTGDIPENFALFALGLLLILVGQLLFARDLRHAIGRAWVLPLVAVVGLVVALIGGENPIHDVGLLVFEAAWVGLGVALLRRERAIA